MSGNYTRLRDLVVVGPARLPNRPLWRADLSLAYAGRGDRPVVSKTGGVRVLLQDAEPAALKPSRHPGSELPPPTDSIPFHTPRLLHLLVRGDGQFGDSFGLEGLATYRLADASAEPSTDPRFVYGSVIAVPTFRGTGGSDDSADWPRPAMYRRGNGTPSGEIALPEVRLTDGRIRLSVTAERVGGGDPWFTAASATKGRVFGTVPVRLVNRTVTLDLMPDGIEFTAETVPNPLWGFAPFLDAGDKTLANVRLRLVETDRGRVLELAGCEDTALAERIRRAFATLVESLERRGSDQNEAPSPLLLRPDARDALPDLVWPLPNGTFGDGLTVEIKPATVHPKLVFGARDGAALPSSADFVARLITLKRVDAEAQSRLTVLAGTGADVDSPSVTLTWSDGLNGKLPSVTASVTATKAMPVSIERKSLQDRLGTLYRAAKAMRQEQAPFLFLPVERGLLQFPLPPRDWEHALPKGPPLAQATGNVLVGSLLVDVSTAHIPRALELDSARGLTAEAVWIEKDRKRQLTAVTVTAPGASGKLDGLLWAADSSPSAEEAVPTLRGGPAASRSLALRFGAEPDALMPMTLDHWSSDASCSPATLTMARPAALDVEPGSPRAFAWLAATSLPLMAAIDMTRSAASSPEPSLSRGLLPQAWPPRADGVPGDGYEVALEIRHDSARPALRNIDRWPLWEAWPWTFAGDPDPQPASWPERATVDLVLPTLPDVVVTPRRLGKESATPERLAAALRFDLPILDGYFASVTLPRTRSASDVPTGTDATETRREDIVTALEPERLARAWRDAADRLALTRTVSAYVTGFVPADDAKGQPAAVTGLVEPYTWRARFAVVDKVPRSDLAGLPFGAYALENEGAEPPEETFRSGPHALAGLSGTFEIESGGTIRRVGSDGEIKVVGYASPARAKDGESIDSRGGAIALEPWSAWCRLGTDGWLGLRDVRAQGTACKAATLIQALQATGLADEQRYGFVFSDLPLVETDTELVFDGSSDPFEAALGPSCDGFAPTNQPSAAHRWRFFEHATKNGGIAPAGAGSTVEPSGFDVPLGPFRFRPLRLWSVKFARKGDQASLTELAILGRITLRRQTVDGPFGFDGDDEAGNIVRLVIGPKDGTLAVRRVARIARATTPQGRARLVITDTAQSLRFAIEAEVRWGDAKAQQGQECRAAVGDDDIPVALDVSFDDSTLPTLTLGPASLTVPLLGLRRPIPGGSVVEVSSSRWRIRWETPKDAQRPADTALSLEAMELDWPIEQAGATATVWLLARLRVLVPKRGTPFQPLGSPFLVLEVELGGQIAWLGSRLDWPASSHQSSLRLDHERKVLMGATADVALAGEPVRGLPFAANGDAKGRLSFTVSFEEPEHHSNAPLSVWKARVGRFELLARGGRLVARHAIDKARADLAWHSRLLIDWALAQTESRIGWPIGYTVSGAKPEPDAVRSGAGVTVGIGNVDGRSRKITFKDAARLVHTLETRLVEHELPVELLERIGAEVVLDRAWHVLATVDHTLKDDSGRTIAWSTLDNVAIVDLGALVAEAVRERDAIEEVKKHKKHTVAKDEKGALGYAFAARYVVDFDKDGGRPDPAEEMIHPGLGPRSVMHAGFPAKAMADRLADLSRELEQSSATMPRTLVVTGAGVTRVTAVAAASVVQPWTEQSLILALPWLVLAGALPDENGPVDRALRFPQHGAAELSWEVPDIDLAAGVAVAPAGRTVTIGILRTDSEASIHRQLEPRLRAVRNERSATEWRMPRLIAVEQGFLTPPGRTVGETPFWMRTIAALRRLWAAEPGPGLATVTILPAQDSGGEALRAILVPPPPASSAPGDRSGTRLIITTANHVLRITLAEPFASDGAARPRHMARAYEEDAEPLAVAAAAVDHRADVVDNSWTLYPLLPVADDFGAAPSRLRRREDLILPSAALDWPSGAGIGTLASSAARLGEEHILQSPAAGVSARVRTHGFVPRAPDVAAPQPVFLSFAEKPVFERPAIDAVEAPAAYHLLPAPTRQRMPVEEAIDRVLAERSRPEGGEPNTRRPGHVLPLMPPNMLHATIGLRPGVIHATRDATVAPLTTGSDGREALDPQHARFGRPAASGPTLLRQGRAPRSTAFPRIADAARRRGTIVAWDDRTDELSQVPPDEAATRLPTPFRWLRGPAGVIRATGKDADGRDKEVSFLIRVREPILGRIGAAWDGIIVLEVTSPSAATAEELKALFEATLFKTKEAIGALLLSVGAVAAPMPLLERPAPAPGGAAVLRLKFGLPSVHWAAVRTALQEATADTPVAATLRYPPDGPHSALWSESRELQEGAEHQLAPLELALRLPLPLRPADRPTLPIDLASVVFADPSYDRSLSGATTQVLRRVESTSWLLATDRAEYDRSAPVVFGFGELVAETGLFKAKDGYASEQWGRPVRFARIPGRTRGEDAPAPVLLALRQSKLPAPADGSYWALPSTPYAVSLDDFFELAEVQENAQVAGKTLQMDKKKIPDWSKPVVFRPGDMLEVAVTGLANMNGTMREVDLAVRVTIVAQPVIAPPPSVFALVRVETTGKGTVPLFATAPLPSAIGYPALLDDLARGLVRRRAHFQWHHPEEAPPQSPIRATLIKIDRSGGGQLPQATHDLRPLQEIDTL
ncbi:hypothetical protein ACW7BC_22220 [Azospirillum argentinense]